MEVEILEKKKNMLKFKVKGETHTLCNILRRELMSDNAIEFAGYRVEHPLINEAIFTVRTGRKDPKKAVKDAITRIKKNADSFKTQAKKI